MCRLLGPPSSTRRAGATENFSRHAIFSQDAGQLLCEDYDMQESSHEVTAGQIKTAMITCQWSETSRVCLAGAQLVAVGWGVDDLLGNHGPQCGATIGTIYRMVVSFTETLSEALSGQIKMKE